MELLTALVSGFYLFALVLPWVFILVVPFIMFLGVPFVSLSYIYYNQRINNRFIDKEPEEFQFHWHKAS